MMEDQTYNVKLYIYDLSKGLARQLSPILLGEYLVINSNIQTIKYQATR